MLQILGVVPAKMTAGKDSRTYETEPQNIEQGIEPATNKAGKYRRRKNSLFDIPCSIFDIRF